MSETRADCLNYPGFHFDFEISSLFILQNDFLTHSASFWLIVVLEAQPSQRAK
jgi:hypothetical protein